MTERDGGGSGDRLAPVIPLFDQDVGEARPEWHPTWVEPPVPVSSEPMDSSSTRFDVRDSGSAPSLGGAATGTEDEAGAGASATSLAEKLLLRRLRTRSLSVAEARALLAGQGVTPDDADEIVEAFARRGYLDDVALAEQIVHTSTDRKGQGRQAVARALAARGIPRDLVDRTLAALPDDDAERALEYARSKVRSMRGLAPEVALRRLAAQLARRGFGSSAALGAARTALAEGSHA